MTTHNLSPSSLNLLKDQNTQNQTHPRHPQTWQIYIVLDNNEIKIINDSLK